MYNLPTMKTYDAAMTEIELLRRYLDKDHAFRTREFAAQRRGLIDDQFYISYGENMAQGVWASDMTLVGAANITDQVDDGSVSTHIFPDKRATHYMFANADGPGSTTSCGNIMTTDLFASPVMTYNYVFTTLFGSYFGDWDKSNNIMRSALASKGSILTCAWSGRPYWWFHHMGNGDNIGYSAKVNMNNTGLYSANNSMGMVHVSLLGDPSLRMHMLCPPLNLKDTVISSHVKLTWSPSIDSVLGYHVYKAPRRDTIFTRLTTTVIKDTFYNDPAVASGKYVYLVKAVQLEKNNSGTFYNTSRGALASNIDTVNDSPASFHPPVVAQHVPDTFIYENNAFSVDFSATFSDPNISDVLTYIVYMADKSAMPSGWSFNATTNTLSVAKSKAGKFRFVIKATDTQLFSVTDTFEVVVGSIGLPSAVLLSQLDVYPNPVIDVTTIEFSSIKGSSAVLTVSGSDSKVQLCQNIQILHGKNEFKLDLTSLPESIYFITLTVDQTVYRSKVMKIK